MLESRRSGRPLGDVLLADRGHLLSRLTFPARFIIGRGIRDAFGQRAWLTWAVAAWGWLLGRESCRGGRGREFACLGTVLGPVNRYGSERADLGAYKFDDLAIAETGPSAYSGCKAGSAEPLTQLIHKDINLFGVGSFEG